VDNLYVSKAIINEGETLWRYRPAAFGRAAPIRKRMSSVEIHVAPKEER
jgi:ribosomal protein L22